MFKLGYFLNCLLVFFIISTSLNCPIYGESTGEEETTPAPESSTSGSEDQTSIVDTIVDTVTGIGEEFETEGGEESETEGEESETEGGEESETEGEESETEGGEESETAGGEESETEGGEESETEGAEEESETEEEPAEEEKSESESEDGESEEDEGFFQYIFGGLTNPECSWIGIGITNNCFLDYTLVAPIRVTRRIVGAVTSIGSG